MVLFPPPLYFVFENHNLLLYIQNISRNELARPVMGTIFLKYRGDGNFSGGGRGEALITFQVYIGQLELFGSYSLAFLSTSVSMANLSHLVAASFSSLVLLSSPRPT